MIPITKCGRCGSSLCYSDKGVPYCSCWTPQVTTIEIKEPSTPPPAQAESVVPGLPTYPDHCFPVELVNEQYLGEYIATAKREGSPRCSYALEDAVDLINAVYSPGGLRDQLTQLNAADIKKSEWISSAMGQLAARDERVKELENGINILRKLDFNEKDFNPDDWWAGHKWLANYDDPPTNRSNP